jgi:hypothetical protein
VGVFGEVRRTRGFGRGFEGGFAIWSRCRVLGVLYRHSGQPKHSPHREGAAGRMTMTAEERAVLETALAALAAELADLSGRVRVLATAIRQEGRDLPPGGAPPPPDG